MILVWSLSTEVTGLQAVARGIPDHYHRARALGFVAEVAAGAGDLDLGKALAQAITDPNEQARALADLARKAEPNQARSLLARALTVGHWKVSVDILVKINPAAIITIADEYLSATPSPGNFL